jgi:hypothetical protein
LVRPQQPPTGPGANPAVLGVPRGADTVMPDGGPGLGGFGTVKPTGNPQKADEDSWDKKLLKMIQDKNFTGAIDALTGGPGKAPQGSPPKIPKNQLSGMVAMRQYPTVTSEAKGILAGASGPASLDMLKPLPGAAKNAPLQKRYDILNKRQSWSRPAPAGTRLMPGLLDYAELMRRNTPKTLPGFIPNRPLGVGDPSIRSASRSRLERLQDPGFQTDITKPDTTAALPASDR